MKVQKELFYFLLKTKDGSTRPAQDTRRDLKRYQCD